MRLPQTMRAMLLTGFGGYDMLQYCPDYPRPEPAEGEVLIQVGACGVNNTDIWTREGAYGSGEPAGAEGWKGGALRFPRIQGADSVGRIVAVGRGVSPARLGERVMVNPTLYAGAGDGLYEAGYIGSECDGGFAEYTCAPAENALAIDSPLSDAQLATFMTSYLTAEHMLNRVGLQAGETILVAGASGGVGSALVQLAGLRRARVVAIVGRGKEGPLAELGVGGVLFRDEADFVAALRREIGVGEVDVVADMVAGEQAPRLLDALRMGGRYVTAGAIAGWKVTLDWRKVYLRYLTLFGSTVGTRQEAHDLLGYIAGGRLKPLLARAYPLEALAQAQMDFKRKAHFGKLVIVP